MGKLSVVILSAGEGTRMKSETPKVLHKVGGVPMIRWVLSAVSKLKPDNIFVVVGHGSEKLKNELSNEKLIFVEQKKQLGSGHAILQTEKKLKNYKGDVLVISADVPLIDFATLKDLYKAHKKEKNEATILSSIIDNPFSYGRICREDSGSVKEIIEEKDASAQIRKIKEINSGIYIFSSPVIWKALKQIKPNNVKKEYYITDAISILNKMGKKVDACSYADHEETLGVNNRFDLSRAEKVVRLRFLKSLMMDGVTIVDPENTYISSTVKIGRDTLIYPGTIIEGNTVIGKKCILGPYTIMRDSSVGSDVEIKNSHVYSSKISDNVKIGPFSHLRPNTIVSSGVRIGNFSETKNSVIKENTKVNHLSYIGDTFLGKKVNVGAGTITCNYDGKNKNKTIIGDNSFIGSNVNLVAPVKIGRDSILGAGSTINENVPQKSLAIARARQVNKVRKK